MTPALLAERRRHRRHQCHCPTRRSRTAWRSSSCSFATATRSTGATGTHTAPSTPRTRRSTTSARGRATASTTWSGSSPARWSESSSSSTDLDQPRQDRRRHRARPDGLPLPRRARARRRPHRDVLSGALVRGRARQDARRLEDRQARRTRLLPQHAARLPFRVARRSDCASQCGPTSAGGDSRALEAAGRRGRKQYENTSEGGGRIRPMGGVPASHRRAHLLRTGALAGWGARRSGRLDHAQLKHR
jgi:hypothetical protein